MHSTLPNKEKDRCDTVANPKAYLCTAADVGEMSQKWEEVAKHKHKECR